MKLLFDENLSRRLVVCLAELYPGSLRVGEGTRIIAPVPDHDRASYQLLMEALSGSHNRRLLIVASDAGTAAARLCVEFLDLRIEPWELTFRQWAEGGFPGLDLAR